MSREYTCAACHQTYEKTWSDAEAMQESVELFGVWPAEELEVVCDDCFKKMSLWKSAAKVSLDRSEP